MSSAWALRQLGKPIPDFPKFKQKGQQWNLLWQLSVPHGIRIADAEFPVST